MQCNAGLRNVAHAANATDAKHAMYDTQTDQQMQGATNEHK